MVGLDERVHQIDCGYVSLRETVKHHKGVAGNVGIKGISLCEGRFFVNCRVYLHNSNACSDVFPT